MEASYIDQLIQGGAMGMFAAFLVWQHIQNTKRLDKLVDSFQEQLAAINKDFDGRIEKMRERYDLVLKDKSDRAAEAQREFARVRESVQADVTEKVVDCSSKVDTLIEAVRRLEDELRGR